MFVSESFWQRKKVLQAQNGQTTLSHPALKAEVINMCYASV